LDWDSFVTVCGSQVNQGNCHLSAATEIGCPAHALADEERDNGDGTYFDSAVTDPTATQTTDPTATQTSDTTSANNGVPTWSIALLVIGSLVLVALIIIVVMLQRALSAGSQHV